MLEKLNSASRSEFLKVWSMDHLHQNHIGQRFSNCSLGFIGYKINLVGWLSIFIKKKEKKKIENYGIEQSILHIIRVLVFYLCVYVYVLNRGIKSIS